MGTKLGVMLYGASVSTNELDRNGISRDATNGAADGIPKQVSEE